MGKVLFSQVCVCPHLGEGVPQSQILSQVTGPRSFLGGGSTPVLARGYSVLAGGGGVGYPSMGSGWGTPQSGQDGVPPSQVRKGHPPSPQDRTAERALATRWVVCLLRSRRRTFLLTYENSRLYTSTKMRDWELYKNIQVHMDITI